MILTAHQPAYLPWPGLLDKIARSDKFVVFDVCPMEDSGFENRNRIMTPTGPVLLTVPVMRSRKDGPVLLKDVQIVDTQPWRRKHWRAIELAYSWSPHWRTYAKELRGFYEEEWSSLSALCTEMLRFWLGVFQIDRPVTMASDYSPEGSGSALVLELCIRVGCADYLFGQKGRAYADVPAFRARGVEPFFQRYTTPAYPQRWSPGGFIPNLSCVDLLMNCGPDTELLLRGGGIDPA